MLVVGPLFFNWVCSPASLICKIECDPIYSGKVSGTHVFIYFDFCSTLRMDIPKHQIAIPTEP